MHATIDFIKTLPNAKTPTKGTIGAAAFDLYAAKITVENDKVIVDTGLATSFQEGYVLLIFSRSGLSRKNNVRLANGVGVVDSDYRGNLMLIFTGSDVDNMRNVLVEGARCAQCILMPIPYVMWNRVESLDETQRGEGGFGSTGITESPLADVNDHICRNSDAMDPA